jgi:hypothetical protein
MRSALVALAALAALLLPAGPVSAESPDLIGGTLTAGATTVTITSQATVPVLVTMHPDGPFTLDPATFRLDPDETVTMAISGSATGRVSATMTALEPSAGGESASVTLEVAFAGPALVPARAVPGPLMVALGVAGLLLAAGLVLALRRLHRRWRIVRT